MCGVRSVPICAYIDILSLLSSIEKAFKLLCDNYYICVCVFYLVPVIIYVHVLLSNHSLFSRVQAVR